MSSPPPKNSHSPQTSPLLVNAAGVPGMRPNSSFHLDAPDHRFETDYQEMGLSGNSRSQSTASLQRLVQPTVKQTVGQFLIRRLKEAGVGHLFGVPGDFVLGFMNNVLKSEVKLVCTCNELNAAYAADAYARINGIGGCVTTYTVGELSAINGIAGSFAESVPVVKITGAPSRKHYESKTLLHHTLGDYAIPHKMFAMVTAASTLLNNPDTVIENVDRVLTVCLERSMPVYIAICSDMVEEEIRVPTTPFKLPKAAESNPNALEEAVKETVDIINASKRPIILPGLDLIRSGLKKDFAELLEKSGLPYATMMLGKGVLDEEHPQFIGLYCGARSRPYVIERVETADCTLVLGERMTDFNTGGFSTQLDMRNTISVTRNTVRIKFHVYHDVCMPDFLCLLASRVSHRKPEELDILPATHGCIHRKTLAYVAQPQAKLTIARLFDRVSHFLPPDSVLIAETGASMFSATELMLPKGGIFMAQTFYGSIGYSVGATLGACIAAPKRRVVVFVGDGSFQVTAQDVSSMIRHGCKPIIFLLNNEGYLIERVIVDRSYNDIQNWKYHKLTEIFGGGKPYDVKTEGELEKVLEDAQTVDDLMFVEVHLDKWDCNDSLRAAGRQMAINNRLLEPGE